MHDGPVTLPEPSPSFRWSQTPWGHVLQCEALEPFATHFFSARGLDIPHPGEGAGWPVLAQHFGVEEQSVWRLHQVHGITARTEEVKTCDDPWPDGDLLATDREDVVLTVRTADCVPLLYADARLGVVAAVHAGWRGTVAGAAPRMVEVLAERFGSRPVDLIVAVGPSLGPERGEVGAEVVEAFADAWTNGVRTPAWWKRSANEGKFLLDLWTISRDQLVAAGVPSAQVHVAGLCTLTHADVFHSYRAQGKAAGRMASAIRRRAR